MRQIGERFTAPDGTLVEVVEDNDPFCGECYFNGRSCSTEYLECRGSVRQDEKQVIFKEVEL